MNIYDVIKIEERKDGTFWVLDKRGPNVIEYGPFMTMATAQYEWSLTVVAIGVEDMMQMPEASQ